jgi:hypothetical protein
VKQRHNSTATLILTIESTYCSLSAQKLLKHTVQNCLVIPFAFIMNRVAVSVERERNGNLHHQESDELQDTRNLRDEDLRNLAQVYICVIFICYTLRWGCVSTVYVITLLFFRKLHNVVWQMSVLCHICHVWALSTLLCWIAKRNEVIKVFGNCYKSSVCEIGKLIGSEVKFLHGV